MNIIPINISSHKKTIFISVIVVLLLSVGGIIYYNSIINSHATYHLYVYPNSSIQTITSSIDNSADKRMLSRCITMMKKDSIYPGHYTIKKGENMMNAAKRITTGQQTPIKLTFNNTRTLNSLAGKVASKLLLDSAQFVAYMSEPQNAEQYGLTTHTFQSLFIPNTYNLYWTISMPELVKRMKREYDRFWNAERTQLLTRSGLSATQVIILASIVEEESRVASEQKLIAGVYLNRLRLGMPLQACPTAIFASGNFSIRRVTSAITTLESPYNTYNRLGLPIGPIRNALPTTIDNVLHYTDSDYLYFCAKGDGSGTHNYTRTYSEHMVNARRFQREVFGKN